MIASRIGLAIRSPNREIKNRKAFSCQSLSLLEHGANRSDNFFGINVIELFQWFAGWGRCGGQVDPDGRITPYGRIYSDACAGDNFAG